MKFAESNVIDPRVLCFGPDMMDHFVDELSLDDSPMAETSEAAEILDGWARRAGVGPDLAALNEVFRSDVTDWDDIFELLTALGLEPDFAEATEQDDRLNEIRDAFRHAVDSFYL